MAESCPGTTYAKLAWLQAWHTRDETYSTALAELVNAQFRHPLPGTGAMAPHHHRTDRISEPLARQRARGTSTQNMAAAQTDFLHPHLRPIRAIPHQGGQCRPARLNLRARRPAVPRIRPADRGALHRHGGLHRSRLRPDAPLGLPLRAAHPRLRRHQAHPGRAMPPMTRFADDRRHAQHQARPRPLGRNPAAGHLDQGV